MTMDAPTSYPGVTPPPSGVVPDMENPKDAGRTNLLVWLVVCNALVFFFFVTRTYAKVWINRRAFLEDATCTTAWALFLLYSASTGIMIYHGEGYHAWEVSPEDYLEILKWLYVGSVVYCPAAYAIKVTLLLLIARIFSVRESIAKAIHIFIVALLIAYVPNQIAKTIICTPIKAYWDQSVKGRCLQQRKIFIADTTLAIVTDLIVLILPIPLAWSLRSPMRAKIKIMALLGAGGVATAVSIFRLYNVVKFIHSSDVTLDFAYQSITVLVELTIGLICSCLPATNILLGRFKQMQSSLSPNSPRSDWKSSFLKFYHFSLTGWSSNVSESGVASTSSINHLEASTVDVESVDIELSERKKPEETHRMDTGDSGCGYTLGQQPELSD